MPHVDQCFVGCSCSIVKVRALHKKKTADTTVQTPFYQFIRNNGNWGAWRVDMISYYPSTSTEEMRTGVMECMQKNQSWNCYLNTLQMKPMRKTYKNKGKPQPPKKIKKIKPTEKIKPIKIIKPYEPLKENELNQLMDLITAPLK